MGTFLCLSIPSSPVRRNNKPTSECYEDWTVRKCLARWHSGDGSIIILEDHFGFSCVPDGIQVVPYLLTPDWRFSPHFRFPTPSVAEPWVRVETQEGVGRGEGGHLAIGFRDSCHSSLLLVSSSPNIQSCRVFPRSLWLLLLPGTWLPPPPPLLLTRASFYPVSQTSYLDPYMMKVSMESVGQGGSSATLPSSSQERHSV